jgi:CBS domain containing-hemolysin-like protein
MEPFHYVLIIVLTTLLSAIFTGVEIAMLSMWKMQLEIDVSSDSYLIKLKKAIRLNPEKYIATIVTGNYFSFVLCTVAFVGLLSPFFENLFALKLTTLVLIVLISAITILLLGKLIPRAIFTFLPNQFLSVFLILLSFFSFMLYPFTRLILFLTNIFGKSNQTTDLSNPLFNRIESNWFINKSSFNRTNKQENVEAEVKLFKNALDFSKVKLREIMVPRTEIEVLDLNSSMEELRQKFVETGFSRIIFYDENVDNIVGYVHSSVIFKNPESFKPFINDVLIVPETMPANKLLSTFIREHRSIAIVVDEFGGTSGMVTSEDILEEIFGEIEDEHDTNDIIENRISDTEFIFSGRSEIDLINEKYQINLPETEDFETLAGYILFHHESIPKINTVIKIGVFQFKILKATNTRIELVKLTIEDD